MDENFALRYAIVNGIITSLLLIGCLYSIGYPLHIYICFKIVSITFLISSSVAFYADNRKVSSLITFYVPFLEDIISVIVKNENYRFRISEDSIISKIFFIPILFIACLFAFILFRFLNNNWYYIVSIIMIISTVSTFFKEEKKSYKIFVLFTTLFFTYSFNDLRDMGFLEYVFSLYTELSEKIYFNPFE